MGADVKKNLRAHRQVGGAALEYILVTTFAAVVGIAALTFVGQVVREQLANLARRMGSDAEVELTSPFGGDGD